ncbi:MAG: serine/threonine-protein kinase [Polyangiaceae bacterium]
MLDDRYELVSLLGVGGMGEVWRARHVALDKAVAVKVLRFAAPSARARFLREARVLAALRHEGLVEVHDFGETPHRFPYFVMELLEGESLANRLDRERQVPAREAVRIAVAVAEGLSAAHAAGVIHRDVKPDNVLLVGSSRRPKVVDFGIASAQRDGDERLTVSGAVLGTPQYMAPEIIRGEEGGAGADVWGLAVTLYEMVAGAPPFASNDMIALFRKIVEDPLPFPRNAEMDGALFRVLAEALRKSPSERTPSMVVFGAQLSAWLQARGEPPPSSARRSAARAESEPLEPRAAPLVAPPPPREGDDDSPITLDAVIRRTFGG